MNGNSLLLILALMINCPSLSYSSWTKQKDDELKTQIGIVVPRYNIDIQAPSNISSSKVFFEPYTPSNTQLSLAYRNLAASISKSNALNPDDVKNYGDTQSTDFQLRLFGKRTYEFFYQSYKGYNISNSSDIDPSYIDKQSKILLPNLASSNYGFNFYWNKDNEHFSQAVAFDQAGVQDDSAWGISWLLHLSQSRIDNGGQTLIPDIGAKQFGSLAGFTGLKRQVVAIGMGLGGITTWSSLYATAFLGVGFGSQNADLEFYNQTASHSSNEGSYVSFRAGLGYNNPKYCAGVQLLSDSVITKFDQGQISGNLLEVKFFYAYRFGTIDIPPLNWASSFFNE